MRQNQHAAEDVVRQQPHKLWESRQSPRFFEEESLDFAGSDASERLGAERLRKVSQKTFRVSFT